MAQEQQVPKVSELPEDIQKVIESTDIDTTIAEIGTSLGLHVDETGEVYRIANLVLMGRLAPGEFVREIKENLGVSDEKAVEITKTVNEKVFLAVRESLKKLYEMGPQKEPMEKKADILRGVESPESIPMKTRVLERGPDTIAPTVAATAVTAAATITPPTVPNAPLGAATPPPQPMPAAPVKPRPTIDPYREQAK